VRAVLDWELSTLGHPATDLALVTLPYDTSPKMPSALSGFGTERAAMGIPSECTLHVTRLDLTRPQGAAFDLA
jgi:aminoglycoside phosphotransferase (APT) family kinase protein